MQYKGGWNGSTCDTTFTEMYTYATTGAATTKRLRVKRGTLNNLDLDTAFSFDNEGRNTAVQYPSTWNGAAWVAGPNLGNEFDEMGRLKKLKNLTTAADIISAATYNPLGQMLTMTGVGAAPSETRSYNSLGQMTQLTVGALNKKYNFSSNLTPGSQNNGKIISEEDVASGEKVEYLYDSLNRLQLAETATTSVGVPWGQSFAYDGFGNLSNVNVTKGDQNTIPSLAVSYLASTNRRTSDCADANGNISPCGSTYTYDVENRISSAPIAGGTARYSYAPGNKRIWRGTWSGSTQTVDELTYYSGSAKLTAYNLTVSGSNLRAASTGYYEFFGGKMIRNAGGYVNSDRLGSISKFFPYGQERPSATTNGKEKFATYFRDAETGLDYADNRYHSSGDGRFLTPDPYVNSAGLGSPGSWNRYAYVEGDPINGYDPQGLATMFPMELITILNNWPRYPTEYVFVSATVPQTPTYTFPIATRVTAPPIDYDYCLLYPQECNERQRMIDANEECHRQVRVALSDTKSAIRLQLAAMTDIPALGENFWGSLIAEFSGLPIPFSGSGDIGAEDIVVDAVLGFYAGIQSNPLIEQLVLNGASALTARLVAGTVIGTTTAAGGVIGWLVYRVTVYPVLQASVDPLVDHIGKAYHTDCDSRFQLPFP